MSDEVYGGGHPWSCVCEICRDKHLTQAELDKRAAEVSRKVQQSIQEKKLKSVDLIGLVASVIP